MNVFAKWTFCLAATCLFVSTAVTHASETLASEPKNPSSPTYPISCSATGDQIVLASTRHLPCVPGRTLDLDTFMGSLIDPSGQLIQQSVSLFEPNEFVETWVLMHGNQITPQMAVERGTRVYRSLRYCSANKGPIRFVIWSWPSERTTNRIADARVKAKRTDAESFYFGSFLTGITGNGPVSILGYSFGARVVSGGMHLAEGGRLCGFYLPDHRPPLVPYRVVFLAAAVEDDGLLPCGRYQMSMRNTESLLLQNNSKDKALRFFWVMNRSHPTALGRVGIRCSPWSCSVQQLDWGRSIGSEHSVWEYIDRPAIRHRILATLAR